MLVYYHVRDHSSIHRSDHITAKYLVICSSPAMLSHNLSTILHILKKNDPKLVIFLLCQSHGLHHSRAQLRRRPSDVNPSSLQGCKFFVGTALSTGDDGTSVTHPSTRRSRHPRNEPHHRLIRIAIISPPLRSLLFRISTNLPNHDNTLRLRIIPKPLQTIYEIRAIEGITADTHAGRLTESRHGSLVYRLVREGARSGDHADLTGHMDVSRHDADLAFAGFDDAGTVGADETGLVLIH
mmetsp:Transcript_12884/g.23233  ORF Transcript_12884/g.23233 Transcript_12884/m.23233 type:complete len:239 (+) Transcript_12884:104-820(+)